jgi:hypothetical protein
MSDPSNSLPTDVSANAAPEAAEFVAPSHDPPSTADAPFDFATLAAPDPAPLPGFTPAPPSDRAMLLSAAPLPAESTSINAPPPLGIRRLDLPGLAESRWTRAFGLLGALAIAAGFFWLVLYYWTPARPGVDQNAYLVGARMLLDHGTTRYSPPDPFTYVSMMWVRSPAGNYYPKYPIGLPVLYAIALKIGDAVAWPHSVLGSGAAWAYTVPPLCLTLSLLATFLLTRMVAGSLAGLVAMLLLAVSPLSLIAADSTMSHAADLCFATWGVYFLVRWWQTDTAWRGLAAGFLLGYCVTIRYSEGLMVIPAAVAMLCAIRWRHPSTIKRTLVVPIGWIIPVAVLLIHNLATMHSLTGYDSTHESTAFTWAEFHDKWEFTIQQFYEEGLLFSLPLGFLGVAMLYRISWRFALLMTSWLIPGVLLYSAYYWGDNMAGPWYLRFFLSLFPPLALGAAYLVRAAAIGGAVAQKPTASQPWDFFPRGALVWQIALSLILVGAAGAIGMRIALPQMRVDRDTYQNTTFTISKITEFVPPYGRPASVPKAVLFVDSPLSRFQLLDALQFFTDADLYTMDTFSSMVLLQWRRFGAPNTDDPAKPSPLQPARREYFENIVKHMSGADFLHTQQRITRDALDRGRPVFLIVHAESVASFRRDYLTGTGLDARLVAHWKEQVVAEPKTQSRFGPAFLNILFNMPGAQSYELYQIEPGPTPAPISAPQHPLSPITAPSTRPEADIIPATSRSRS